MLEGQIEQSGVDRSRNNIVNLESERLKPAGENPPAAPVGEISGKHDAITPAPAQTQERATVDFDEARRRLDQTFVHNILRKRFSSETRTDLDQDWKLTNDEWQRVQRVDPNMYDYMRLTNRIHELQKQAGKDKQLFDELWQKELTVLREQQRNRDAEEEIKHRKLPNDNLTREELEARYVDAGCKPLTEEQWQKRHEMKTLENPAKLTLEQWQEWRKNSASLTVEELQQIKQLEKLMEAARNKERQRRQDLDWSGDLGDLGDGHYVDVVLECAEKQGVDPRSLTPGQRQELRIYHRFLTDEERKLDTRDKPRDTGQLRQNVFETFRETWETNRLRPEKDFLAFQQWFWSLPLDVVVDLWERAPKSLRPELETPDILQVIAKLYGLLRDTVKALLPKSSQTKP